MSIAAAAIGQNQFARHDGGGSALVSQGTGMSGSTHRRNREGSHLVSRLHFGGTTPRTNPSIRHHISSIATVELPCCFKLALFGSAAQAEKCALGDIVFVKRSLRHVAHAQALAGDGEQLGDPPE